MNKLVTLAGAALIAASTWSVSVYADQAATSKDDAAVQDANKAMLLPEDHGAKKQSKIATDPASRQRGAETVLSVCMNCHSLKYVKYRDLETIGFSKEKAAELRGDKGRFDPLKAAMPEEAALASFGVVPPDLSMMAKARHGREHYVPEFLTSFYTNEKGLPDNKILHNTKMPDILGWGSADEQGKAAIEATALDVGAFLMWTADPKTDDRYRIGKYVLIYVVILTLMLYLLKKKVWRNVKQDD